MVKSSSRIKFSGKEKIRKTIGLTGATKAVAEIIKKIGRIVRNNPRKADPFLSSTVRQLIDQSTTKIDLEKAR